MYARLSASARYVHDYTISYIWGIRVLDGSALDGAWLTQVQEFQAKLQYIIMDVFYLRDDSVFGAAIPAYGTYAVLCTGVDLRRLHFYRGVFDRQPA